MATSKYSLNESPDSNENLVAIYNQLKLKFQLTDKISSWKNLDLIFQVAVANRNLFPVINVSAPQTPEKYIEKWIKKYTDALHNLPSKRVAKAKNSCSDPALKTIVKTIRNLSDEAIDIEEKNHNLFMAAENVQGNLLEEYIANQIEPYGFVWCMGEILKAIDFCSSDGRVLLQIKNKFNTENSSSNKIREGSSIEKWYRLGCSRKNKKVMPKYMWETLNDLINQYKTNGLTLPPCQMSEESYEIFLKKVASENKNLITDL